MSVEKLKNQATQMEKELKELLDSIKAKRLEFHALNYFTTQQLLQIRRDLGNLKQDSTREVTPQLLSLLSSFSLHITSDVIKNVVEVVCTIFNEQKDNYEEQESKNELQQPLAAEVSVPSEPEKVEHNLVTNECVDKGNELTSLIENLSKDEEDIFEQLKDVFEYSDLVCYKAVKHAFASNSDDVLEKAMMWCFKISSQYENEEDVTSFPSVSINEISNTEDSSHQDVQFEATKKTPPKENIDIKHPVVQKLIESNFTPELSIKGAKKFGGNFEQAFEWCLKCENKNNEPQEEPSFISYSSFIPVSQVEEAVESVR